MTRDMESDNCCKSCCRPFGEEFVLKKFSLYHKDPKKFCCSQWQRGDRSIVWLIYRWLLASSFGVVLISSEVLQFEEGQWFIYLTNWGWGLCWFTFSYAAIVATIYFVNPTFFAPGSWALRIFWVAHFSATIMAFFITMIFWTAPIPRHVRLLDQFQGRSIPRSRQNWMFYYELIARPEIKYKFFNTWAHAMNSICMLFDLFIVAFPSQVLHFVYPIIFGVIYMMFSLIYYLAGGTGQFGYHYIYYILDWKSPGIALGFGLFSMFVIFVLSILVYWIYRFRVFIYKWCIKNAES